MLLASLAPHSSTGSGVGSIGAPPVSAVSAETGELQEQMIK